MRLGHGLGGEQVLEVVAHADAPRVHAHVAVVAGAQEEGLDGARALALAPRLGFEG